MTVLGTDEPDLYDWAEPEVPDEGAVLVDAARTGYRQVVRELRSRIFAGKPPYDRALPAQSRLAEELGADVALVNRAAAALAAEGLVRVEHGKPTVVLKRKRWWVEFRTALVLYDPALEEVIRAQVASSLAAFASEQPAVSDTEAVLTMASLAVRMTVEAADLGGAVTAALPAARVALGSLPVAAMTAAEDT